MPPSRSIDAATIPAAPGPVDAIVSVPGSKSLTNRALLVAALARGESTLTGALYSDDTRYMSQALRLAGVDIQENESERSFLIRSPGGAPGPIGEPLFLGLAGTAMRFLTSYFALGEGTYRLDGTDRMRRRPIQELLDALNEVGGDTRSEEGTGCPPVVIHGRGLQGGRTSMPGDRSSQFASSLMLSAPYSREGVELEIRGRLTHQPYLDLTADVMEAFGIPLENQSYRRFRAAPGTYNAREYAIEPDASTASYFMAAAAVTAGRVVIPGLSLRSRQGDIHFAHLLCEMGCSVEDTPAGLSVTGTRFLRGVSVDMNSCSDVALTLAAVAPFCATPTHVRNVAHMRLQESDRIKAIVTEMERAGVPVEERGDGFSIYPAQPHATLFETYDDHRMAMSLAIIGLRAPGCAVKNPGCVAKTFPDFFNTLRRVATPPG